jgi:hypothetical protein
LRVIIPNVDSCRAGLKNDTSATAEKSTKKTATMKSSLSDMLIG